SLAEKTNRLAICLPLNDAQRETNRMASTWKWILGILAILILGLIITGSVLSRIGKPKVQQKLSQQVNQASSGLYTVRFEDMDFQLWSGTIALQHVELLVDTGIYTQLAKE